MPAVDLEEVNRSRHGYPRSGHLALPMRVLVSTGPHWTYQSCDRRPSTVLRKRPEPRKATWSVRAIAETGKSASCILVCAATASRSSRWARITREQKFISSTDPRSGLGKQRRCRCNRAVSAARARGESLRLTRMSSMPLTRFARVGLIDASQDYSVRLSYGTRGSARGLTSTALVVPLS